MRSVSDDRSTKAAIRDEALRLFADRGPDAVGMREIAAAAGVSPALILHHWQSKDGLRAGVDEHVATILERLLDAVTTDLRTNIEDQSGAAPEVEAADSPESTSIAQAMVAHLPPDSPIPAYLRRLLLVGDPRGLALMRRWHQASLAALNDGAATGIMRPGRRPEVRAAVLMANDLAVLLLRDGLHDLLGEDPLGPSGLAHWTQEVTDLYRHGLITTRGANDAS